MSFWCAAYHPPMTTHPTDEKKPARGGLCLGRVGDNWRRPGGGLTSSETSCAAPQRAAHHSQAAHTKPTTTQQSQQPQQPQQSAAVPNLNQATKRGIDHNATPRITRHELQIFLVFGPIRINCLIEGCSFNLDISLLIIYFLNTPQTSIIEAKIMK